MQKKIIFSFMAVLLSIVTVGGIYAQVALPGGNLESPQSQATQGRIRGMADDFIRADSYVNAKFEKWFGFTSFASADTAGLGFATKIGSAYISALYRGNLWVGRGSKDFYDENQEFYGNNRNFPTYENIPDVTGNNNNTGAVLVGINNMGFRLAYRHTFQSFKENDIAVDDTPTAFYKDYQTGAGGFEPQIVWAMTKDLLPFGLRPYAGVNFLFDRNYLKTEAYTSATGTSGERTERSSNYFSPTVTVNTGGFTFYNKNGFRFTGEVEYILNMRIYNNDYSYMDGSTYKTNSVKGIYTGGTAASEDSYLQNTIMPAFTGSWTKDKLALRLRFNLPFIIRSQEKTGMQVMTDGNLRQHGDYEKSSTFIFAPDLRLVAQWWIIPKLALNVGGRITANNLNIRTSEGSSYNEGNMIANSSYTRKQYNYANDSRILARLDAGFTVNATDNFWFEVTSGLQNNVVSIFDSAAGFLRFTNILAGVKF